MALFECSLTKAVFIFLCYIQYFDNMQTVLALLNEKPLYLLEVKKHAERSLSLEYSELVLKLTGCKISGNERSKSDF